MKNMIVRQPVFNIDLSIFGYEILYKNSSISTDESAANLISKVFLEMDFQSLSGGKPLIINFSNTLLKRKIPLLLPSNLIWISLASEEDIDEEIIEVCKELKAKNYKLILNNLASITQNITYIDLFDIIKIDFSSKNITSYIDFITTHKDSHLFLANNIQTREDYKIAKTMNYNFLEGDFFTKPVELKSKSVGLINSNLIEMLSELNKSDPSFDILVEIIKRDLGMTYRILKTANSVAYASKHKIESLRLALLRIGLNELKKWVYLLITQSPKNIENSELINLCLIRGKFMELLSIKYRKSMNPSECFITGMFSSIHIILNKDISTIFKEILLPDNTKMALLGKENDLFKLLKYVRLYEKGYWELLAENNFFPDIKEELISQSYLEALAWADNVDA